MEFYQHEKLQGQHAVFSASQSSWLRYTDEKVLDFYENKKAAAHGTRLHNWAKETIELRIKQPRSKQTLYAYVNDAIGFDMKCEVVLYFSPLSYGTADAISFDEKTNLLRIHDLKTGTSGPIESHIEQLEVYAAYFCLEYNKKPKDIKMELRVYKNDDILYHEPEPGRIEFIIDQILRVNKLIAKRQSEEA